MKARLIILGFTLIVLFPVFGQTPPTNDNFANRMVLTGTNLTFTGTLAGATLEAQEPVQAPSNIQTPTKSVWWAWTAPATTVLNLEILSASTNAFMQAGLAVYVAGNGVSLPNAVALPALGGVAANPDLPTQVVSVSVTAGSNYLIQLVGDTSATYSLGLIATNNPLIIRQPRSLTVSSNDCALFYVIAAQITPLGYTYQWLFNGNPLPGETAPMLSLTNVDASAVGSYSVIISNGVNFSISQVATLTVSTTNVPISLAATGAISNVLAFAITGESGRSYRFQTSTNLTDWTSTGLFSAGFPFTQSGNVAFSTNTSSSLAIAMDSPHKYIRALPYEPPDADSRICVNNLTEITIAKLLWQIENNEIATARPAGKNIRPYFPRQILPSCPFDFVNGFASSYNMNQVRGTPACLISPSNHVVEVLP